MNFSISQETLQELYQRALTMLVEYTPKFISAIVVLVIGWIAIGFVMRGLRRFFNRVHLDPALESFIMSFSGVMLKIVLLVVVATMFGVQTTSLVALLGAAGLAVGLALQGSLSNFAGGVLILFFKPFKLGDYIEAQGVSGTVNNIQIFNTILKTPDNKTIVLPNGNLANDVLTNYSTEPFRRLDFTFGIGYGDDIKLAKDLLEKNVVKDERVISDDPDRKPQIVVGNLGESSVDIFCRVWVKTDDYWNIFFEKNEAVKEAFDKNGISIPFPQQDVHHYYENGTGPTDI
ncbi:mechanosensitive ion channel [bacterium]|nr:mechanosensitive ion channel [bacterium]NCQ55871.1 mechanosensitive ion channel [Candidatus Parcubacteria bacterium]NCS67579.1 mechanosensitive ion channel [Candidatus Peregrinibacteria bacterium]NCS96256.1 mechanosensitive ion channel [bacterium]